MTEAELLAEVTDLCGQLGLIWHHCAASARCRGPRGFPDLVIAGLGGVIFAELKTTEGDTTAEQDRWLYTLARSNLDTRVFTWRPADLDAGRIRHWLGKIATPGR